MTTDVRVVRGDVFHLNQTSRTPAQKHTDEAFDRADKAAEVAFESFVESVAWARAVGMEIPKQLRMVETLLAQFQSLLTDERGRR